MSTVPSQALELIKRFEGLSLKAYRCDAGVLTIGYGSTGGVTEGEVITREEAEQRLQEDAQDFWDGVLAATEGCPTSDAQRAAMTSLAYNIGLAAFRKSTVLKMHLAGKSKEAADAFLLWTLAGGQRSKGLARRREAERLVYLNGSQE